MLEIEVIQSGTTLRFRISDKGKAVSLLTLVVQEADTDVLVWVLGPSGMVMTQETAVQLETRSASAADIEEFEKAGTVTLGGLAVEVSEITYGLAPAGLDQAVPEAGVAPPLVSGRRYLVLAAGPAAVGTEGFVLEPQPAAF